MATAHFFGLSQQLADKKSDTSGETAAEDSSAAAVTSPSLEGKPVVTCEQLKMEKFDFSRDYHFRDELLPVSDRNPVGSQFALLV